MKAASQSWKRRTRVIGRQVKNQGSTCKLNFPVVEFTVEDTVIKPASMPVSKVSILNLELRQWRRFSGREALPDRGELFHEDLDGPSIGDNVMSSQQQHFFSAAKNDESTAKQWPSHEIERTPRFFSRELLKRPSSLRFRQRAQIHNREIPGHGQSD